MSKSTLTRKVRRAYSRNTLSRVLTLPERKFGRAYGMQTVQVEQDRWWGRQDSQPEDYYHFRDNGANVLAVAHLDTVVRPAGRKPRFHATASGPAVVSGALDDRLGAYVILHLLPAMGVTCDWLLTVGEESGQSTAEQFKPAKDYEHVIEFDRMGTDVVMYQYEDRASERLIEAAGAVMGHGSFSDIAYLEHLGVKAFNWGVGYRGDYHSERGYAFLNDTFAMVAKYARFHEQNAGLAMPHEPDVYDAESADGDRYLECSWCGAKDAVSCITWYCDACGCCQDCGATDPDIAAEWNDPEADICQCYLPKHIRDEVAELDARDDARNTGALTWDEYVTRRDAIARDSDKNRPAAYETAGVICQL